MTKIRELLFGKVCDVCGGRYWNWDNHVIGNRHLKVVRRYAYAHGQGKEFDRDFGKFV